MKAVVILEVMWDWRNVTTSAGYQERAPRHFSINPLNHTGKRLHAWLKEYPRFQVTNACPELVSSAKGRGKPDASWLSENLQLLGPFDLLLVCGGVARSTYKLSDAGSARVLEIPHPAARCWTRQGIDHVHAEIQNGTESVRIHPYGTVTLLIRHRFHMNLPEHLVLKLQNLSTADQCLIHRYLYYILNAPALTDRDYDMIERAATEDPDTPVDHAIHLPGSDLCISYPEAIADLALQIHHRQLH